MSSSVIPIANLYYMLCYAWNRLDEKDFVQIEALPKQDLPNLLARILTNGVKRLLRQGIDRTYISRSVDSQNPRGKIDLTTSLKRGTLVRNTVVCIVDDLAHDVLHNQILRTTMQRLSTTAEIDSDLQHELRNLDTQLTDIRLLDLRFEHFRRVQLHRNNGFYRFLLHVCELCYFALLADERRGTYRFKDFVRDEVRMRKVFQEFIYRFYDIEQKWFTVSSERRLDWDADYLSHEAQTFLPEMRTDVCLENSTRKIVIECKYTPDALKDYRGKLSARSNHLYQLFAYLKHLECRGGVNSRCDGLLLYPAVSHSLDFSFRTQGHMIRVVTLELNNGWSDIRNQLLRLIEPW